MLSLALLSGGSSTRMGQDKALMPFLGRPLIQRILERLQPMAEEVILSTNRPADFAFLNLPSYADIRPNSGSLGGLFTCLSVAGHSILAAVACDMPFVNLALFRYERLLLSQTGADVVIPATPGGLEPLHAVYRRETCLPAVHAALEAGEFKMTGWLSDLSVRVVLPDEVARFDPQGLAFWNLNTPQEFQAAEEKAKLSDAVISKEEKKSSKKATG
ncbi:MAG TPA: molybdenum cofactor guanylyltransferase [Anaerolineales bacterium]|nr:molybdenum cofactor guanylyltransferase [Anaerolineales bacterium]